jgi:hypothetical protein
MDLYFDGDQAIGFGGDRGGALPVYYVYWIFFLVVAQRSEFRERLLVPLLEFNHKALQILDDLECGPQLLRNSQLVLSKRVCRCIEKHELCGG